jgi:hypothetical protein
MDEYDIYQGTHSGGEIDRDLDFVDGAYANQIWDSPAPDAVFPAVASGDATVYGISGDDFPLSDVDENKKVPTRRFLKSCITGNQKLIAKKCVKCAFSGISSLPQTKTEISMLSIVDDTFEVIGYEISNPNALGSALTVTTATGSVTISGTIYGTTDVTLYLASPDLGGFLS